MATTSFCFAPSIHWCRVHGFSVILDVENDKYLSIPARQFEALLPYIEANPSVTPEEPRQLPDELAGLAAELVAKEVLISTNTPPAPREQLCLSRPEHLISTADALVPIRHAIRYLPHFVTACIQANHCLQVRPFRQIVARVTERRRGIPASSRERLAYLTRVFHALRPFYPRSYLCLFDSLALLEFLWHWRLSPRWVFGVTIDPFEAHCWVQEDALVLCDTRKFGCRWLERIMVV